MRTTFTKYLLINVLVLLVFSYPSIPQAQTPWDPLGRVCFVTLDYGSGKRYDLDRDGRLSQKECLLEVVTGTYQQCDSPGRKIPIQFAVATLGKGVDGFGYSCGLLHVFQNRPPGLACPFNWVGPCDCSKPPAVFVCESGVPHGNTFVADRLCSIFVAKDRDISTVFVSPYRLNFIGFRGGNVPPGGLNILAPIVVHTRSIFDGSSCDVNTARPFAGYFTNFTLEVAVAGLTQDQAKAVASSLDYAASGGALPASVSEWNVDVQNDTQYPMFKNASGQPMYDLYKAVISVKVKVAAGTRLTDTGISEVLQKLFFGFQTLPPDQFNQDIEASTWPGRVLYAKLTVLDAKGQPQFFGVAYI